MATSIQSLNQLDLASLSPKRKFFPEMSAALGVDDIPDSREALNKSLCQ